MVFVACLLLSGCGTLSKFQVDASNVEAARYARSGNLQYEVDSLARPLVDEGITPGIVVGVLTPDGQPHFYGYGVADKSTGVPVDADMQFAIGSLRKGFLGVITAQLVNEGILSWDDTLGAILPADVQLSADAKKITVQQLATHTSGLPRQPFTEQTLGYFVQYLFTGKSFYRHFDRKFAMQYLANFTAPSTVEPRYSNIGYGLLGYVVELRSGQSLDSLLQQRVLTPLWLTHTGYGLEAQASTLHHARGYAGDQPKFISRGQPVPDWQFTDLMKGSAAMHSTARDLLTFAAAYMRNSDSPLGKALADTLQVDYQRDKEAAAVAWVEDSVDGQSMFYQIGLVAGYTSFIGLDPKHHAAVVVLQNSFNWSANIGYQLLIRMAKAQDLRLMPFI
jgi:CubicO group peptidase (beta-lactamase class C family)